MPDRVFAVFDSRFLSRVGNAVTLVQIVSLGGAILLALLFAVLALPGLWRLWAVLFVVWVIATAMVVVAQRRTVCRSPVPDARRRALTSLIGRGSEIMDEAQTAGHDAGSLLGRPSAAELAAELEALRAREAAWIAEAEALLDAEDHARFVEAPAIPASGHYAISNRLEARLDLLREVRDGA